MNPLIVIPSRLRAARLPDKPLAEIHGEPMIVHVWRRAVAAGVAPVVVACGDAAIAEAITARGGSAVMTDPELPSGSDRVYAAAEMVDPDRDFDVIINLQGDLPTLDPAVLRSVLTPLQEPAVDIATLAAEIVEDHEILDPGVIKIAMAPTGIGRVARALYFSRCPVPHGEGPHYHHIGVYAFRRAALRRFVALPQAAIEVSEHLEQLRALADGMRIDVAVVQTVLAGVDTPADLARARAMIGKAN